MTPTAVERGRQTQAGLLDAAAELIVEQGWGAVTTRKVAARAGLRPGVVHYHFDTVTDLLVAASLRVARREVAAVVAVFEQPGEAAAGLHQVLAMMTAVPPDSPSTVLFAEMLLAATRVEPLREGLAVLLGEWRAVVARWLETHGVADPAATALLLGAVLDSLVLYRRIDPQLAAVGLDAPLRRLVGVDGPRRRSSRP